MSPVDGVDPSSPVTTTYDADESSQLARGLHAFITDRTLERVATAAAENDWGQVNDLLRGLHLVDAMYAAMKRSPERAPTTVQHLYALARRDRDHAQFRSAWPRGTRRRLRAASQAE